ncbi:MAG TPA: hypothetical protein VG407_15115 [Caulobacteraceae bacterium]|jgi:hypothetical protein|nr:hypothetical protein [Caulobacteraceae bacterium]
MRFPTTIVVGWLLAGPAALLCAAALAGCDDVEHYEVLDGPYRLVAENRSEDMAICYQTGPKTCVSRVDGTVYKVGFDKLWVVAARHPPNGPGVYASADRSKIDYFILDRRFDGPVEGPSAIRGPMPATDFERLKKQENLPSFSRVLKIDWQTACKAPPCE